MLKAEAVVIGGGVIGTSIAYYLAKDGRKVILLERDDLASGTSGACTSTIWIQSKQVNIHLKMALESAKLYDELTEELDFNIEYRISGGMIVIEDEEEMEAYSEFVRKQRAMGLDVELLDISEARKLQPALSERLAGSTYSPMDRHVNPLRVVFGFARKIKEYGGEIHTGTEVKDVIVKGSGIKWVKTNRGDLEANIVINAAGIDAATIGDMVNLKIPIVPVKGQELVTEAVPILLRYPMLSTGYMALKHPSYFKDFSSRFAGLVAEQTVNGNILLGTTKEKGICDRNTTVKGIKAIAQEVSKILPVLKNVSVIRTFAGLRPETPDGLPIIGEVDGLDGFIIACGHGGDGIALAPITGKIVADLINKGKPPISLNELSYSRFAK
ncbi:MAG: FAD-binding oxidoreductase [Candidatus Bathyarchaeia archaeon]